MDHASVSQIGTHFRCQEQWRRRYVEGHKVPPGIAALVGTGLHWGAKTAMIYKGEHGQNLHADEVRDAAVAGYDDRLESDDLHLGPQEKSRGRRLVVGEGRDMAAAYGETWASEVQPDYMPREVAYVEWSWRMPLPRLEIDLVGITDLVDDSERVVDWKTGAKRLSQRDADASIQLLAYTLAAKREFRHPAPRAVFEQLVYLKKGPQRHAVAMRNGSGSYDTLLARVSAFVRSVRTGVFVPCDPTSWCCSRKWCGYADTCKYYIPELEGE